MSTRTVFVGPHMLVVHADVRTLVEATAARLAALAAAAISDRGRFTWALSGGSTPAALYRRLADPDGPRVAWEHTELFFGDERNVPPDHTDSNYRMAREALFEPAGVPASRIHRIEAELGPAEAARRYGERLRAVFGTEGWPRFDLVLLGLGTDAHTASLFPGTPAVRETTAWVVANPVPQLATERVTITRPILDAAREVWFLVNGASKTAALRRVLLGDEGIEEAPARAVAPHAGKLLWLVDEDAIAELLG